MHSHTEPHFFPAWIEVLGFDWIWEVERFKGAPYRFPDEAARTELIARIEQRMAERTAAEWLEAYVANGNVCGDIVQTTQEALHHPQLAADGGTIEVTTPPGSGRADRAVGQDPTAPAHVRGPAPLPGQHSGESVRPGRDPRPPHPRVARDWPAGHWPASPSSRPPTTTQPLSRPHCWPIWVPG